MALPSGGIPGRPVAARRLHAKRLRIRRHQQEWWHYCGAAVAQMMLNHARVRQIRQDELFARAHPRISAADEDAEVGAWETSPSMLARTLNDLAPRAADEYHVYRFRSIWSLALFVADRIECGNPVAMHVKGLHWVVAVGFTSDRAPRSAVDPDVKLRCLHWIDPGEILHDPGFVFDGRPPPHSVRDRCEQKLTACYVHGLERMIDYAQLDDGVAYFAVARGPRPPESLIENPVDERVALVRPDDDPTEPAPCLRDVDGFVPIDFSLGVEVRYLGRGRDEPFTLVPRHDTAGRVKRLWLVTPDTHTLVAEEDAGQGTAELLESLRAADTATGAPNSGDAVLPPGFDGLSVLGPPSWMGKSPATSPFRPARKRGLGGDDANPDWFSPSGTALWGRG